MCWCYPILHSWYHNLLQLHWYYRTGLKHTVNNRVPADFQSHFVINTTIVILPTYSTDERWPTKPCNTLDLKVNCNTQKSVTYSVNLKCLVWLRTASVMSCGQWRRCDVTTMDYCGLIYYPLAMWTASKLV